MRNTAVDGSRGYIKVLAHSVRTAGCDNGFRVDDLGMRPGCDMAART